MSDVHVAHDQVLAPTCDRTSAGFAEVWPRGAHEAQLVRVRGRVRVARAASLRHVQACDRQAPAVEVQVDLEVAPLMVERPPVDAGPYGEGWHLRQDSDAVASRQRARFVREVVARQVGHLVRAAAHLLDRDDIAITRRQPASETPPHRSPYAVGIERGDPDHAPEPTWLLFGSGLEPVAQARFGDEVAGLAGVGLELATDLREVHAEVVRLLLEPRGPDLGEQLA